MDNRTLKAALVGLTGGAVKVRKASASRGDGIDIFLPKAVRLDVEGCAVVVAEVRRLTGRHPFLLSSGARGDVGPDGACLPNFHIQPLFEEA